MNWILAITLSFLTTFAQQSEGALKFFDTHRAEISRNMGMLSAEERKMACAIVAPELSQYSRLRDRAETEAMYVCYVYQGSGNFSIGLFQMKPGFVEMLESDIRASKSLRTRHAAVIKDIDAAADDRARRRLRLKHLESADWQMKYLAAFFDIAKQRTAGRKFASSEEKLRYFATLYNSGYRISSSRVAEMQKKKLFPRQDRRFNYAEASVEFYRALNK